MAETPQNPVFQKLVSRFGIKSALALWTLLNSQASDASKALAGTRLAGSAAHVGGKLAGSPGLAGVGRGLGTAAGVAGVGMGIHDIATAEGLSTKQKAGHANQLAGETALALGVPYAGLAILAKNIIGKMEQSSSPQVSGVAKGLAYPARPVEGLLSVLRGDKSPRAAGNMMVEQARNTPGLKQLINPVFDLFGLGTKPTTGTTFRREVRSLFDQIPTLKGIDTSKYNMEGGVDAYNAFSPEARARAEAIARTLGPLSSTYTKQAPDRQQAYVGQLANILLNNFGNRLPALG